MQKLLCLVFLLVVWEVSVLYAGPMKELEEPFELFEGDLRIPKLAEPESELFDEPFELFEGDIRLPESIKRSKRNAVRDEKLLWPNGVVPYTISTKFNRTLEALFRGAMDMIEDATQVNGKKCVEFVPRSQQAGYIHLEMYRDCSSDLGRRGNKKQLVTLGMQCYTKGTVMHELLHALGFFHEQSRTDRDDYIDVHRENIQQGTEQNFQQYPHSSLDHLDMPYDYDSIMHYRPDSFSKSPGNLKTIVPKLQLPSTVKLGQRDHLSIIDIWLIQKLYGCPLKEIDAGDSAGLCRDKLSHCYMYGQHACSAFPAWSEENCARTCKFCEPVCEDKQQNCAGYGKDICSGKYKSWSKTNCAKYCGLGDCEQITTPPPLQADVTTPAAACVDLFDCSQYSKSACTIAYMLMKVNCPRHCSLCPAKKTTTTPKPTTTTATTTTAKTTKMTNKCANKVDNCDSYVDNFCTSYPDWAETHCPMSCGFCIAEDTTVLENDCFDVVDDCWSHTRDVCKSYPDWSSKNCRNFCGMCTRRATTTAATTTTTQHSNCYDQVEDCNEYTASVCESYPDWSKKNCKMFCGLCKQPATTCVDKIADCAEYSLSVCTSYVDWSRTNCPHHCGLCD